MSILWFLWLMMFYYPIYGVDYDPVEGRTIWIQTLPPIMKHITIPHLDGGRIRDRLTEQRPKPTKEIVHDVSPSLHLLTSDTGNDKFLPHSTIKHSISDLSTLSEVQEYSKKSILSCEAIQDGPKIYFITCPGDMVVVTIAGSMKMTCHEIEKRIFFGPVTIKTLKCQQSFLFEMDCDKRLALKIENGACEANDHHLTIIIQSVVILLLLAILILIIIWYRGTKKGILIGGQYMEIERKGCYYSVEYDEYIKEDGTKGYKSKDSPSELNMVGKTFRKHWIMILLYLIICKPIRVDSYELISSYDSTRLKYSYQLILEDSEEIAFGSNSLKREEYFCQWQAGSLGSWT